MKAMEDYKPSILLNTIKATQIMHSIPVNIQVRVQSIRYAKELFIESFRGNQKRMEPANHLRPVGIPGTRRL